MSEQGASGFDAGKGNCANCGTPLVVVDGLEGFLSDTLAGIPGDPVAELTRLIDGAKLEDGAVVVVGEAGGAFHCSTCGHRGTLIG